MTNENELTDAEMAIALYGDGLPTYQAYGSNAGERIWNTKADDADAIRHAVEQRALTSQNRRMGCRCTDTQLIYVGCDCGE